MAERDGPAPSMATGRDRGRLRRRLRRRRARSRARSGLRDDDPRARRRGRADPPRVSGGRPAPSHRQRQSGEAEGGGVTVAPIIALVMAAINLTIWTVVAVVSARDWQHFHDERAARGVLLSLVLLAAGVGGMISASGYYLNVSTGGSSDTLAVLAGLARGAMIVGGFAYIASL